MTFNETITIDIDYERVRHKHTCDQILLFKPIILERYYTFEIILECWKEPKDPDVGIMYDSIQWEIDTVYLVHSKKHKREIDYDIIPVFVQDKLDKLIEEQLYGYA